MQADTRRGCRELTQEAAGRAENPLSACPVKLKERQAGRGPASTVSLLSPERQPSLVSALLTGPSVAEVHPESLTANYINVSAT